MVLTSGLHRTLKEEGPGFHIPMTSGWSPGATPRLWSIGWSLQKLLGFDRLSEWSWFQGVNFTFNLDDSLSNLYLFHYHHIITCDMLDTGAVENHLIYANKFCSLIMFFSFNAEFPQFSGFTSSLAS